MYGWSLCCVRFLFELVAVFSSIGYLHKKNDFCLYFIFVVVMIVDLNVVIVDIIMMITIYL